MNVISDIDEIIGYFDSASNHKKGVGKRKLALLPEKKREEVLTILRNRGIHVELDKKASTRTEMNIRWEEEEWEQLAGLVWKARKNHPNEGVVSLVNKVMANLPTHRRRTIRTSIEIKPLLDRLKTTDETLMGVIEENIRLRDELKNRPERDQVLVSLTDDEVLEHYGQRVLNLQTPETILANVSVETLLKNVPLPELVAFLAKSSFTYFSSLEKKFDQTYTQMAEILSRLDERDSHREEIRIEPTIEIKEAKPKMVKPKKPKVTIVGLLPNQHNAIEKKVGDRVQLSFLDKNRGVSDLSTVQDTVILMANFIDHAISETAKQRLKNTKTKLVTHHGGVSTVSAKISELFPLT